MIAGLESITSGDLMIDGARINDVPPDKRGIAMVFQSYALYPHMTVAANIGFSLDVKKKGSRARCGAPAALEPSRPTSGRALGRPTPAGGDRARDYQAAARDPLR